MANQIQNKLNQFEVTPPDGVWEKISAALDDQSDSSFVDRILHYEVIPPAPNWEKIETALSTEPVKQESFLKRHHKLFVYSGAAAAIVVLVMLVTLLLPGRTISNETKGNQLITKSIVQSAKKDSPSQTQEAAPIAKDDGRYITLMKDDGKKIRLSKKVLPAYTCATSQVNEHCKKRIEHLQDKMASPSLAPSVDFAGFVELVKNLNEDQ
jgi:hypothetical protein